MLEIIKKRLGVPWLFSESSSRLGKLMNFLKLDLHFSIAEDLTVNKMRSFVSLDLFLVLSTVQTRFNH